MKIKEVIAKEYCLVEPYRIVERKRSIRIIPDSQVLLKPVVAGICGSEMLYYKGQKEKEKLEKRLPMCLLHEGVAEVVQVGRKTVLKKGTKVVVNPLIPCGSCSFCKKSQENLCEFSLHMAATTDGLARTFFVYPEKRLVPVPNEVEVPVAVLTEPLSIALNAVERADIQPEKKVAVIGDGTIGYFVALMTSFVGGVEPENLFVLGVIEDKIALAKDFSSTINSSTQKKRVMDMSNKFDVVFECVGGSHHQLTLDQTVNLLRPNGKGILLGISKGSINVQVTKIVNKGLALVGLTRSRIDHYTKVLECLKDHKLRNRVDRIISGKNFRIESAADLNNAFQYADTEKGEARNKPGRILVSFP